MTPEKLDELYALAKKATPGPWLGRNKQGKFGPSDWYAECDKSVNTGSAPIRSGKHTVALAVSEVIHDKDIDQLKFNADFIAATSPDVITALIDRVRELERALDNAVYLEPKLLRIANISNARAALDKEPK